MKNIFFLFIITLAVSCTKASEKIYVASTPAGITVRAFLGIQLTDSVDFIRWKLILKDDQYHLDCNYGIGKPNTNGFINGGKKIALSGAFTTNKNILLLQNGNKVLRIAKLNDNLFHLLNDDNSLLNGNGGWSYTLNNIAPVNTKEINITAHPVVLKDSMAYQGRTPCKVPGLTNLSPNCYKLKWYMVLYANAASNEPGTYKVYGTSWRQAGPKTGNWKIITGKDGRIIYQLNEDDGKAFLYLLKLDGQLLVFTDAEGKLPVGDEDFSYTLNRK